MAPSPQQPRPRSAWREFLVSGRLWRAVALFTFASWWFVGRGIAGLIPPPALIASAIGSPTVMRVALALGASADAEVPVVHLTPLMLAAGLQRPKLVAALLAHGADPDRRGPNEATALYMAVGSGDTASIRLLAAAGAELNGRAVLGTTALDNGEMRGQREAIRVLLEVGASPELPGSGGYPPLWGAAISEDTALARILLDAGADPDRRIQIDHRSVREYVNEAKSPAMRRLFARYPAR